MALELNHNWGEPERALHKREVRAVGRSVCLSVSLSVRTFMTRKYTRTVLIYGYLQLLIAAFKAGLVHWFVDYTNIQQTCNDKQLEQTGSYTKKQVYRWLMNNNFI